MRFFTSVPEFFASRPVYSTAQQILAAPFPGLTRANEVQSPMREIKAKTRAIQSILITPVSQEKCAYQLQIILK
jgi:hypothetical protein